MMLPRRVARGTSPVVKFQEKALASIQSLMEHEEEINEYIENLNSWIEELDDPYEAESAREEIQVIASDLAQTARNILSEAKTLMR